MASNSIPYRNPIDDRPERRESIVSFFSSALYGIVTVLFFDATFAAIVYGRVGAPCGLLGAILLLRRPRRRISLAGFLIGAALTSVVQSTCFMTVA